MQTVPDKFNSNSERRRFEMLLQMSDLVVRHDNLGELFRELATRLQQATSSEYVSFSLHDPAKNQLIIHIVDDAVHPPRELEAEKSISGWVWKTQEPVTINDVDQETRFPECLHLLRENALRSCYVLPLTTAQRRLGAIKLGSTRPNVFGEMDMRVLQRVAVMAALAVENVQTHAALQREKEGLRMLLEVNTTLGSDLEVHELFPTISSLIRNFINQDFASISLYDEPSQTLRTYALDYPVTDQHLSPGAILPLKESGPGIAFLARTIKVYSRQDLIGFHHPCTDSLLEQGIQSGCCVPLITGQRVLGVLNLASRDPNVLWPQDLLKHLAGQVAVAMDNGRAYREIAELKERLSEETRYLQGEIRSELNFEEIIGESPALKRALEKAKTVAPSYATVLILGETGTGKELIARAIHRMSTRKDGAFIKLNCAAIPTGLLESELFGHEKGAFTGAVSQKIGRLELADKGTLFLDEVGDIPLELQPKLLRVLQDQEFERLGSTRTIKVNIRMIAATNRDLLTSVANHEFRMDLYYRINVFPLRMPALRERQSDIPLLVRYFVQKFAARMNKNIESIRTETIQGLQRWDWPGNVRELENFIERSVILTGGSVLSVPIAELSSPVGSSNQDTLKNLERDHIIRVLRETGGVVGGLGGAASRLGMKRTTLQSMISRMCISRREYEN